MLLRQYCHTYILQRPYTYLHENFIYSNEAKWEAAEAYCKKKNYKFLIINEKNIDNILSS